MITNGTAESDVERIARHVYDVIEAYFDVPCLPTNYEGLVEVDRIVDWDHPINDLGIRPYSYQLCSYFVYSEYSPL